MIDWLFSTARFISRLRDLASASRPAREEERLLSNRRVPQAQSDRMADPPIGPPISATPVWYGTVNGHAQAGVIATVSDGKPNQSAQSRTEKQIRFWTNL